MRKFMLGAYWKQRRNDIEDCTKNAHKLFQNLAMIDPLLGQWYQKGRSLKDALKRKVDTADPKILQEQLLRGRNRSDVSRKIFEDLGFSINLWNGIAQEERTATISIHCGCYSKYVGNNVLINLPSPSQRPAWIEQADILLALVAEIWQPDQAGITSNQARRERHFSGDRPFVDWMVYVPQSIDVVPPPGRVKAVPGVGSVVVVQPEPPLGDDPQELARIHRVENILATYRRDPP